MTECAHCGKEGTPTPIADKVGELVYHKIEICLCVTCETLYRGKDLEFMQWLVVHQGTTAP